MKLLREQQSSEKSGTWQRNQRRLGKLRSKYYQLKKINKPELSKFFCYKFVLSYNLHEY